MSERGAAANLIATLLGGSVIAGLIVGALLGLTGAASLVGEPAVLADAAVASYFDCPDGDALGTVTRGDRVFITGRDASGDWAEIRSPNAPNTRVWMRAHQVLPDGDTTDLPVFACNVPVEAVAAAVTTVTTATPETTATTEAPETTVTTEAPTTTETTATTQAPPPTNTTVAADTTPPSIGQQQASPGTIWELDGGAFNITCSPPEPRQSTVLAVVTDDGGIASVTASWTDALGTHNVGMAAGGNTYTATVGPYPADTWEAVSVAPFDHTFTVTMTARDTSGNESSVAVNVTAIEIGECFG